MDNFNAKFNLALCYYNGEGTEKNLEKAFYWYQKVAENGNEIAMNNLATRYKNGEGTEKNLEKAFYWYQKAAENGNKYAMNNLAICYKNGEGTEKNLEKAFYWYQIATESNKIISKDSSNNELCKESQQNAKNSYEVLEWIPYNNLKNINYHDKGGFSQIHKAIWLDGPIDSWNFDKQQWNRLDFQGSYEVILKNLNNS
ncbi:hypothetical protein C1645_827104 [Glomus cerebriforme]|uniref:HCP-like protein n=1 Tax=Glomus cerebriforme TaxID=658196 RepID=A0A397SSQ6_9GLOM|nr:hypothetical protein C1645_827104 [Glomus cerebriforme]